MNFRILAVFAIILAGATPAWADEPPISPPISLSLKNATLREAADALGKAAGVSFPLSEDSVSPQRFTVDLKDKPFWDVFKALASQAPLRLAESAAGIQLQTADPGWGIFQYAGDMAVIPGEFHYRQTISLQPAPAHTASPGARTVQLATDRPVFTLDLTYAFDPRLKVTRIIARRVLSVVDNSGNILLNRQPGNVNLNLIPVIPAHYVESGSVVLNVPEHPGTRIAALDGDCIFEYMPTSQRYEIAPIESLAGKDLEYKDAHVVIDAVTVTGPLTRITGNANGGGIIEICDVDGRVVNLSNAAVLPTNKPFSITAPLNPAKAPYKAIITVGPVQQKTLLFHLADLPLPLPRS